jgi:hypothetical protein
MTMRDDIAVRPQESGDDRRVIEIPGTWDLTSFQQRGDSTFVTIAPGER